MPLRYSIDRDTRIVTISGDYAEPEEWRVLLKAVSEDPYYRPGSSFLRDLRQSANPVGVQAVMGIIAVVREFWPRLGAHKAAIVTPSGIHNPAVVAEALAEADQIPIRAFTRYEDAVSWLQEGRANRAGGV